MRGIGQSTVEADQLSVQFSSQSCINVIIDSEIDPMNRQLLLYANES